MHEWLRIIFCSLLINLNLASPFNHVSKTTGTISYVPAKGCSCVNKSDPVLENFGFSNCGFRSGDPWPFCIVEGECSFKFQTSVPNVFYTPCMRQVIQMEANCDNCDACDNCAVCAEVSDSGKRQILTRSFLINSLEKCLSTCLNPDVESCTHAAFYNGGCSLFSSCETRDSNILSTVYERTVTISSHKDNSVQDPTPVGVAMENDSDLDECRCKDVWLNPFKDCNGIACREHNCKEDENWCEVFNSPCKTMYKHGNFHWSTCSKSTPVATPAKCRCKATWDLPELGANCIKQIGCSFSSDCRANSDHGVCAFDEDSCNLDTSGPMPCDHNTPHVEAGVPECQCKENWEWASLDPNCINQQGCASPDCWYGSWCLVKNSPCRGQYGNDPRKMWSFCPKQCKQLEPGAPDIRRRYDSRDRTLIIVTYHWPKTKVMRGKIQFTHLDPGEIVLLDTDSDSDFSLNRDAAHLHLHSTFNVSIPLIECRANHPCNEQYSVNIRSVNGYQVVFLRFITQAKIQKIAEKVASYQIKIVVNQCENTNIPLPAISRCAWVTRGHLPSFVMDECPREQIPYLVPFTPHVSRSTSSPTFPHRPKTSQKPSAGSGIPSWLPLSDNWNDCFQIGMIGLLSFIIFILFLSIHNLDTCCDSLARSMFTEETMTENLLDPSELQRNMTEEILSELRRRGVGETSLHPIVLDEPGTTSFGNDPLLSVLQESKI